MPRYHLLFITQITSHWFILKNCLLMKMTMTILTMLWLVAKVKMVAIEVKNVKVTVSEEDMQGRGKS